MLCFEADPLEFTGVELEVCLYDKADADDVRGGCVGCLTLSEFGVVGLDVRGEPGDDL